MNEFCNGPRNISFGGVTLAAHCATDSVVQILGCKVSIDAEETQEFDFKIDRAWKAFWRLRKLFMGKELPIVNRLRLLSHALAP
eukprot:15460031-Alexandrium_andersonii.AAC.1